MESNNTQLLSNLKILNIQILDNYDEILIKDVFPNLVKLKIQNEEGIINIINISYNLLNRIQIQSLIKAKIEIDTKNKEIELLSLKSLKIVDNKYQESLRGIKIICPNLEYLILSGSTIYKFFSYGVLENLSEILLTFPKLIYCNISFSNHPCVGRAS